MLLLVVNKLISSEAETMPTTLKEIIVNSKNNKNIPAHDELKTLDISKTRIADIEDATKGIAIRRNSLLTPITTFNIPDKTSNRKVFEIKNVATDMEEHENGNLERLFSRLIIPNSVLTMMMPEEII